MFAGVPTMVMPATWKPAPITHAALGWNASLEAFRAARTILDLVEPGTAVDVVIVDALDGYKSDQPVPGVQIDRPLHRHGHNPAVQALASAAHANANAQKTFALDRKGDGEGKRE